MLFDFGVIVRERLAYGYAVMIDALLVIAPKSASPKKRIRYGY
jgi:hypothetical protein|tara:strand:+ start:141 stop:269 length:129 start_codon:yes stop_codon:yes gene_type:complete